MPFNTPTLADLRSALTAELEARLPCSDPRLRRSFLGALTAAEAGAVDGLYAYQRWMADQLFPDTAEAAELARWALIWGLARKPAEPARGSVMLSGSNGVTIPAGVEMKRGDGLSYLTTEPGLVTGGSAVIPVQAMDAGPDGNTAAGSALALVTPIAGVVSRGSVTAEGLAGGTAAEGDSSLRARLLARIRQPPHGGADFDYLTWALDREAHGQPVTRAWVFPQELGLGTVTLRFMADGATGDGIPDPTMVALVAAHVEAMRPVTAEVLVLAPEAQPIAFEIEGLLPDTPAIRAAVEAELRDLILREAVPGGTLLVSHVREAISIAAGETDHGLVAPVGNVTVGPGEISTFGSITWS